MKMKNKIKIVFNSTGSNNIGSYRIPFEALKNKFLENSFFEVYVNDFENYHRYDIAILHADEEEIFNARSQNKDIIIGLAKPHHERIVHKLFYKFNVRSVLYQLRMFIDDEKSKFNRNRNLKLSKADFLIADTMHLKHFYESKGHQAIYLKLIEGTIENTQKSDSIDSSDSNITFGYHGNHRHFVESVDYIFPALNELSKTKNVILKVVTNKNLIDLRKLPEYQFEIELIDYEYPGIYKFLNDTDIGLVPNQITFNNRLLERLIIKFGAYFWHTDRYHDLVFRYKQSVNAGRAFVFAQLGIPFVACPIPEVMSIFGGFMEEQFPYTKDTWKHVIIQLANNHEKRKNISQKLLSLTEHDLNIDIEAKKLSDYIIGLVDNKSSNMDGNG